MADPRTVMNPFTRNQSRMRRNSRSYRWVTADSDHNTEQRSGPSKTVKYGKQQPQMSHVTPLLETHGVSITFDQPKLPILQAAIHDPSDLLNLSDTYTRRPSVRSWASLRPGVHFEDEDVSSKTVISPRKSSLWSQVSTIHTRPTRRDSPVPVTRREFALKGEANRGPNATLFPYFPSATKKSDSKARNSKDTQAPRGFANICRTAKAIYAVGPKGEGQKFWSSYKKSRKGKQNVTEVKQTALKPTPTRRRRPSQASRTPLTPKADFRPRKNSDFSLSSCEVPVRIGSDIQRFVDAAKLLPPVPHIQTVPRAKQTGVDLSKRLPRVLLRAPSNAKPYVYADPSKPLPPVPLFSSHPKPETKLAEKLVSSGKPTIPSKWWPSLPKSHAPKSRPHISRPRPITALQNGRTANVAVECGGVGGPDAKMPPGLMSEKARGMQRAGEWMSRRKSSDASFGCQGVDGGGAMGRDDEGRRDTEFYGAYGEVLDEY